MYFFILVCSQCLIDNTTILLDDWFFQFPILKKRALSCSSSALFHSRHFSFYIFFKFIDLCNKKLNRVSFWLSHFLKNHQYFIPFKLLHFFNWLCIYCDYCKSQRKRKTSCFAFKVKSGFKSTISIQHFTYRLYFSTTSIVQNQQNIFAREHINSNLKIRRTQFVKRKKQSSHLNKKQKRQKEKDRAREKTQ